MTPPCPRLGKLIGGCRFEARYEPAATAQSLMADYEFSADVDLVIATKLRGETYFGEACIRCGKIIKRESEG